jgi:DNA-binding CsgD family transcriptional regulator
LDYITIAEAAEKWGVSARRVYKYLEDNRVKGVIRFGSTWMIPTYAEKPCDPRREKKKPLHFALSSDLAEIITATTVPMPRDNPDMIIDTINEERFRLQYEGELAYLRGNFELTKLCYQKTKNDDIARLRACSVAIASAISTGDFPFYLDIESFLKGFLRPDNNDELSIFAELCLASAYTGAHAPNIVPDWLINGDFKLLHPNARPDAVYKRAKYFQCIGKYDAMLAVGETALVFFASKSGLTFHDIYFRIICAIACFNLHRQDDAERWLLDAMHLALPHGFVTPFAEMVALFSGQLERLLSQEYPQYLDIVVEHWNRTVVNWMSFHNRFTRANVTLILSLREYQIALLASRGIPFKKIAEQFNLSLETLNNNMQTIYQKLHISEKKELAKHVL